MLILKVEGLGGDSINEEAKEGLALANKLNTIITTDFNGVSVSCYPFETVQDVLRRFNRDLKMANKCICEKYQPYTESSLEWLEKIIIDKESEEKMKIEYVGKNSIRAIALDGSFCSYITFDGLLSYVWEENNKPCGLKL